MKQRPALERVHVVVLVGWAVVLVALVAILVISAWEGGGPFTRRRDLAWGVVLLLWGAMFVFSGGIILAVAGGVARLALAGRTSRTVLLVLAPPLVTLAVIGALWGLPWSTLNQATPAPGPPAWAQANANRSGSTNTTAAVHTP